jgi:hypothetical protein
MDGSGAEATLTIIYLPLAIKQAASFFKDTARAGQFTALCAAHRTAKLLPLGLLAKRPEACPSLHELPPRCTRSPHTVSFKQDAKMGLVRQFLELAGDGATRVRASPGENKMPAQRQSQKQGFAETSTPKRMNPK